MREQKYWQEGPFRILHCYADWGVESEALTALGEVIRVGWNIRDTNSSTPIKADAHNLPFDGRVFDLGVFHPPCTFVAQMTSISGDPDDHDNEIPHARKIANEHCEDYIIENKPKAIDVDGGLEPPEGGSLVTYDGKRFGKRIAYDRAFECSFPVENDLESQTVETEISPYFYSDRSTEFWRCIKGYNGNYQKEIVAKNCVPRSVMEELLMWYLRARGEKDSLDARSTHSDPKPEAST